MDALRKLEFELEHGGQFNYRAIEERVKELGGWDFIDDPIIRAKAYRELSDRKDRCQVTRSWGDV